MIVFELDPIWKNFYSSPISRFSISVTDPYPNTKKLYFYDVNIHYNFIRQKLILSVSDSYLNKNMKINTISVIFVRIRSVYTSQKIPQLKHVRNRSIYIPKQHNSSTTASSLRACQNSYITVARIYAFQWYHVPADHLAWRVRCCRQLPAWSNVPLTYSFRGCLVPEAKFFLSHQREFLYLKILNKILL